MNLYLIGYRCTGKTTIGRLLAETMKREFIDADKLLEKGAGLPISEIVSNFGWKDFRDRERMILQEIGELSDRVVATGGGIVENVENIRIMRETGVVIWLQADPDTILQRMQQDPETERLRPALTSLSLSAEIDSTLSQRTQLYLSASHIVIDTTRQSVETIAQTLMNQLRRDYAGEYFRPDVSDHHVG